MGYYPVTVPTEPTKPTGGRKFKGNH
jgi:hypothetical protein